MHDFKKLKKQKAQQSYCTATSRSTRYTIYVDDIFNVFRFTIYDRVDMTTVRQRYMSTQYVSYVLDARVTQPLMCELMMSDASYPPQFAKFQMLFCMNFNFDHL